MVEFPNHLQKRLQNRIESNQLRTLKNTINLIDFSSNDYLSLARDRDLYERAHQHLLKNEKLMNGSTGSRLLSGHSNLTASLEEFIAHFHQAESALLYNSGYTANLGFFSTIPTKQSIVLYDELIHASIRDGLQLSNCKSYKFKHNSLIDLEKKLLRWQGQEVYVSIEAIYSMDGDQAPMQEIADLCTKYQAYLIIDEAHFFGTISHKSYQDYCENIGTKTFARLVTYGKALGAHGAVIIGSKKLKKYLINFSRSLIYTTALSPHSIATIQESYKLIEQRPQQLQKNINHFRDVATSLSLKDLFLESNSPIQSFLVGDSSKAKFLATKLQEQGFSVFPILSPTVPLGKERLRFCIHSHNTTKQIDDLLGLLKSEYKRTF